MQTKQFTQIISYLNNATVVAISQRVYLQVKYVGRVFRINLRSPEIWGQTVWASDVWKTDPSPITSKNAKVVQTSVA